MINTIALDKLVASPRNVRRRQDEQADRQLMADIAARGLLQNLVVTAVRKPRGSFAVEAGGRRLKALQQLAADGQIPADHPVCCLVVEAGSAGQEASLAENFQRLGMNPADECLAFRTLIAQGAELGDIARRFGLTTRFVEGRLRLADLAPIVFEALGAGEITLDEAKAYGASADQERQAWVFEQLSRGYGAAHPDSIRRMMTQASASASDRRALLVGEEAYLAAGGRIEQDLFTDGADARWLDVALLERLAIERMEAAAAAVAGEQGLAFVRPTLERWVGHDQLEGLKRIPLDAAPLSDAEQARVDAIEAEIEGLALEVEDEEADPSRQAEVEARARGLAREMSALLDKPPLLEDAQKGVLGTFLLLDEDGSPRLDRAFYARVGDDDEGDGDGSLDASPDTPPSTARSAGLSQRLTDELAMQRRDILAVHVAADPAFALDLAIFLMVDQAPGYTSESKGSSLQAPRASDPVFDFKTPEAPATIAWTEDEERLERSWTEGASVAERFDAFRALSEAARAAWLGHAVARTLEASLLHPGSRACAFHDHLGRLLGIDVARWWRPTGANFFDRVPKAVTLAALEDVGGPALASRYAGAKKAELAQSCERIFAGDFIAEAEAKEAALAWVPAAMRFDTGDGETASPERDDDGAEQPEDDADRGSPCQADETSLGEAA